MSNKYRMGRIGEKKVANYLQEKGFTNIRRSAGSRGPWDIYARGPEGDKFYIQVKIRSARPTRNEIRRLRALAKERHGVAAVIHRDAEGKHQWRFLGNWSRR
jgi:Holliday junction resolvase